MVQKVTEPIPASSRVLLPIRSSINSLFPSSSKRSTHLFRKAIDELTPSPRHRTQTTEPKKEVPKKPTFQWVKGELLGKGSYAKVYLGLNATTGEIMAVKQVELPQTPSDQLSSRHREIAEALKFERQTLMGLDHPNVVQYLGYEESPNYLSIFLEYVPGGTISACLQNHGVFSEEVTKSFTRQILEGLDYLHCKGIIHRDLKSDNILVEPSGICKISDFGISKQVEDISQARAYTGMRGTIYWMAPEILDNGDKKGYDVKVDIWSIGCVVLEMWTGERPWFGEEIFPVMLKLSQDKSPPPIPAHLILTEHAADFRLMCFQRDPQNRPSAADLQTHRYLQLPRNWRFDPFEIAPLQRSLSRTSRRSRKPPRSIRRTQSPFSVSSEDVPAVPPISDIEGNSTYRPIEQSVSYETLHATPPRHQRSDGPQVVFITPLNSPPPQLAQLPNSSRTSLDTAGSVSTPRKGFRVINPDDPELQASKKAFIYHPPPLPSVDTASPFSSRLLPPSNHRASRAYPTSHPRPSSPSVAPSSRKMTSRHSHRRQTQSSHIYSDYTDSGSDGDDDIWAKRPADLSNSRGDSTRRTRSVSQTLESSRTASAMATGEDWLRPVPAAVYENLQDFFPEYDLDKAIIPIGSTSTLAKERGEDRKKSIRVVAKDRAQAGPRRRTKLWDSKVEELHM